MKKSIVLWMLATSIMTEICAQEPGASNSSKTFEPPDQGISFRFLIDLDNGNKMQLELSALRDLSYIRNIDSFVHTFLQDIQPLKDSLADELLIKRIDCVTDSMERKKIHLQQYAPKGSSFVVTRHDIAALKLEQDTVHIMGFIPANEEGWSKINVKAHCYRISFFINQLSELPGYLDGRLNKKIDFLIKNNASAWIKDNTGRLHLGRDYSISAAQPKGYARGPGDYLELKAGVNLQNYKNYFVPSFNIGASVFVNNAKYKYEVGLAWEPHFLFAKNNQGNFQTFRNDFITLTLGREPLVNGVPGNGPHVNLFEHLSLGYLVSRKGEFIDNHTFRVGTGSVNWSNGKLKLEPVFYFHDVFKNLTPGLRLSLNF